MRLTVGICLAIIGSAASAEILESTQQVDVESVRAFWTYDRLKNSIQHTVFKHSSQTNQPEKTDILKAFNALESTEYEPR
jgi:hypothetical protein